MPTLPAKPRIALDGSLTDWIASERIDYNDLSGYSFYAQPQDDRFYFALSAPTAIGPNTTFWFNTDQNTATGYQIFGNAGGAEYNVNIKTDGTVALYSGAAGQTLVLDNLQIAYSADRRTIEFAIPKAAIGTPPVIKTLFDVNDTVFGPTNYSAQPYIAYDNNVSRTDPSHKIGIVYSATTAAHYFSPTAYSQLFMAVQSQAMQAGISFDTFGKDIIADFAASGAAHDIINIRANPMLNSFAAVMSRATQVGTSVVIAQNSANSITLLNTSRSSLSSADFRFV